MSKIHLKTGSESYPETASYRTPPSACCSPTSSSRCQTKIAMTVRSHRRPLQPQLPSPHSTQLLQLRPTQQRHQPRESPHPRRRREPLRRLPIPTRRLKKSQRDAQPEPACPAEHGRSAATLSRAPPAAIVDGTMSSALCRRAAGGSKFSPLFTPKRSVSRERLFSFVIFFHTAFRSRGSSACANQLRFLERIYMPHPPMQGTCPVPRY